MHRPQLQKTLASSESPRQNQQQLRSFCNKRSKAYEAHQERPMRENTLSSKFVQVHECILCMKKIKFREFPIIMNKALHRKYYVFAETFQIKAIDKILNSPHSVESIRFTDLKIWANDEQFFKRFYLAQEFGQKFKNLWKFHQFSFNEPRFNLRKGQRICEKYYRQHRKLQERGIRKMLDLLSDSQLENMQIDLNHFIAIKEEIIEHKAIKTAKPVLEELRFSIEEQNYSAKVSKAFDKGKLWCKSSSQQKRGLPTDYSGTYRDSAKKIDNNKLKLKEAVKEMIVRTECEPRQSQKPGLDSFDRLVEYSNNHSEIMALSMVDQSYSLFEFTKTPHVFDSEIKQLNQPSDSNQKEYFDLDSEFDIQNEVAEEKCQNVDSFSRFNKMLKEEKSSKARPILKAQDKTSHPRIDSELYSQNLRKIKYKDEVGTFFKKMANVPSREFIKSTVFHSAKEIAIPDHTLTSKTFKGGKQAPLFTEIAKHTVASAKHLIIHQPANNNLTRELKSKPKLQSKNENLKIVNFYKKTTEVMQSINNHNELIKISDCLPSKESHLQLKAATSKSDVRNVKKITITPSTIKARNINALYSTKTDRAETQYPGSNVLKMFKAKPGISGNVKSYEHFPHFEQQTKYKDGQSHPRKTEQSILNNRYQDISAYNKPSISPCHSKERGWIRMTAESKTSNHYDHFEQAISKQASRSKPKANVFPMKAFSHLLAKQDVQSKKNLARNSSFKVVSQNSRGIIKEKQTFGLHINNPSLNNLHGQDACSQPKQSLINQNQSLINFKNAPTSNTSRGQPTTTKNPGRVLTMFSLTAKSTGSLKDGPRGTHTKSKLTKTPVTKNISVKLRQRDSVRANKLSVELQIDDKTSCDAKRKSVSPNIYDYKTFYRTAEPLVDCSSGSNGKRSSKKSKNLPTESDSQKLPAFYQSKYKLRTSPLAKNMSSKKFFVVPDIVCIHSFSPEKRKNERQTLLNDGKINEIWIEPSEGVGSFRPTFHKTASLYSKKKPKAVDLDDLGRVKMTHAMKFCK